MDLGVAEWKDGRRRYFVNAAGIGFDAAVAQRARAGRGSGTVPYLIAVLETLRAYAPFSASVSLDGGTVSAGPFAAIVIANGAHYGGGMKIAPAANPADGLIDLVILGDLGRIELLRWLPTVYRGKHLANPKVTAWSGRTVDIDAAAGLPMHLDGEPAEGPPVRLSVCPRALRLRR
jgi:diacylglycerol kinase family enzyme